MLDPRDCSSTETWEAPMKRFAMLLVFGLVATAGAADKAERPEISGMVLLGEGLTAPANFRVDVEVFKLKPNEVLTIGTRVARHQIGTAKSFPVPFACVYPQSVLKDASASSFVIRASVYDLPKASGAKLIYQTP